MKARVGLGLGILSAIGMLILWWDTPWGIGVGYDSVFYLSAANNFLHGYGFSRFDGYGNLIPLTHFPPLYPFVLSATSWLVQIDTVLAARLLATLWFGGVVFLIGWLVFSYTGSSLVGLLAGAFALTSPLILDLHLLAMSEPLFILLFFLSFFALERYLSIGKIRYLLVASFLAALAYLDRYIGLSVVGTGALAILLFEKRRFWRRIIYAGLFALIGILPSLLWMLRNLILVGSATNRTFAFHLITRAQLRAGMQSVSLWLLPARFPPLARGLALALFVTLLLAAGVIWIRRSRQQSGESPATRAALRFVVILLVFTGLYLLMLGLSLTFFDASTRLNDRILSPVYTSLLAGSLICLWQAFPVERRRIWEPAFLLLGLALVGLNGSVTRAELVDMRENGRQFTGRKWQSSETIAAVKALPADTVLFTNESLPVYFLVGRGAIAIPEKVNVVKGQKTPDYDAQLADMQQAIRQSHGALVIFDSIQKTNVYPPVEKLTAGLVLWKDTADGTIYLPPK